MADDLKSRIQARAKAWANDVKKDATKNLGKYKSLISVSAKAGGVPDGAVGFNVNARSIRKDDRGKTKVVARAYEYGSGIHSQSTKTSPKQDGVGGFIIIKPRKPKKLLAFPWDVLDTVWEMEGYEGVKIAMQYSGKFIGVSDRLSEEGRPLYLFRYVEHPGVQAANGERGYLRPAIAKIRRRIRKELPKDVRDTFIGGIRKKFK